MSDLRVRTTEDSVWTRNRGCGDLLLLGGVFLFLLLVVGAC